MQSLPYKPRLLVIIVARFGDTLLVTPTLAALKRRWPQAQLTVLAHPGRLEVLENLDDIDHLAPVTKGRAAWMGRLPGSRRYDAALVYGGDAALFAYAARVSRTVIGFEQASVGRYLTHPVAKPGAPMIAAAERALLLAPLGVDVGSLHLQYRVSHAEAEQAAALIAAQGWQGKRLVGFQLQSFPTKAYRDWPVASFAELARLVLAAHSDVHIVLLGGPEGRAAAEGLAGELGARVSSVAGTLTMRQNAALLSRLALYVGVDTGPTHLAGALDVPMVAMYHCFHRGAFLAPQEHPRLIVMEHPCSDDLCRRDTPMALLPVQEVFLSVMDSLGPSV